MAVAVRRTPAVDTSQGASVRRAILALAGVASLAWLVLWLAGFFSTPKEVLEVRALVDAEVAQLERVARNEVPFTDGRSQGGEVFGRMRDMPEGVREQARAEMGRLFRARERAELASYFGLPPEKRQAELDRRIKADQERWKAREQERASRAAGTGAGGGPGQGREQGGLPQSGGSGRPGGGGPTGGGSPQPRGSSDEAMLARRKQRLDTSTPDERARSAEYRRAMEVRRAQLGISPRTGRGA